MPGASASSSDLFAAVEANSGYLGTEAHYLSLARRILAVLRGGSGFALLTGDPPANLQLLSQALSKATEPRHPVIGIACGPGLTTAELISAVSLLEALATASNTTVVSESSELGSPLVVFDDVGRLSRALSEPKVVPRPGLGIPGEPEPPCEEFFYTAPVVALPTSRGAMEPPEPSELASPLFVFSDVHRLSQQQLRAIYDAITHPNWMGAVGGVLVAPSGFLSRLEKPGLCFLKERLVAQFRFQEIGRDEDVESFHHRLANRPRDSMARAAQGWLIRGVAGCGVLLTAGIGAFLLPHSMEMIGDPSGGSATRNVSSTAPARADRISTLPTGPPPAAPAQSVEMLKDMPYTVTPGQLQPARVTQAAAPPAMPSFAEHLETPQGAPPATSSTSREALTGRRLSAMEIAALVTRGDEFLSSGDVTSARLFYERAANGGDGPSALRMGATFDPTFLRSSGIRGTSGDPDRALSWYARARELDSAALQPLLKSVEPRQLADPAAPH